MKKITRWLVDGEWRTAKQLAYHWTLSEAIARHKAWRLRFDVKRA